MKNRTTQKIEDFVAEYQKKKDIATQMTMANVSPQYLVPISTQ